MAPFIDVEKGSSRKLYSYIQSTTFLIILLEEYVTVSIHRQLKIPIDRQHIMGHAEVPDPYIAGGYGGQATTFIVQVTTDGGICT